MGIDDIIARETSAVIKDCKPGCAWCCNQLVVLTNASDGEAILELARKRTTAEEFQAITEKVREQAEQIAELPYQVAEEQSWPCPLLKDKKCLVYEARPIACRTVFSPDNKCCKAMMQANDFSQLSEQHRQTAHEITERALRLQLAINNSRPIDGAFELRSLLVSLMDAQAPDGIHSP